VRIVLCDEDVQMREMVEALVATTGHDVVGVADTTADAVGLVEAARPDAVILDLALGFNSDFDIIESAISVGSRAIVFSHHGDLELLRRYDVQPTVVAKPDLVTLEQVLLRLDRDEERGVVVEHDRRHRPARAAAGHEPTGVGDAQAFFEAINAAEEGDAIVSIDLAEGAERAADDIAHALRATDRLLVFPSAVRFYLPGGGDEGIASLLRRIADSGAVPHDAKASSVILREGEHGADAFDRLKQHGDERQLPG
jgi:hypothetical protein